MNDLTQILARAENGDRTARERLVLVVYQELREMARREMEGERVGHTLQPTALVHEAYLRLLESEDVTFESRAHFFGAAAQAIRRVLVEHARSRGRQKRGGGRARLDLDGAEPEAPTRDARLLDLDAALEELAGFDERKARLVELRFFAGMTVPEIARAWKTSESTVAREWRFARSWLHGVLEDGCDGP